MIWLVFTFAFLEGELMCYLSVLALSRPWTPSHLWAATLAQLTTLFSEVATLFTF